jgi:preprotein translocase subunit SecE
MEKIRKFFREVRTEAKKTHWPSRKELLSASGVVLIILIFFGFYFFFVDLGFSAAVGAILKAIGLA